jgi:cell division protein FtsL
MDEWTVVGVIVVLFGLMVSVVTPLLKLNTSITQLTCAVSVLQKNIEGLTTKNSESHTKLWEHNSKQDSMLADHETRIKIIENAERGA